MTMMMSNLPHDLVEEILSRVPLKSLKAVRSTCKKWNALTQDRSFTDKHIGKVTASGEKEILMLMDHTVYLIGVNLHGIQNNNVDLSIKRKAKLITLGDSDFHISQVFHCNGLLLCVFDNRLVVRNPYCGKPKCIKRMHSMYMRLERFALGYDKSCGSHKVLSLFRNNRNKVEIYDLSSNSWTVTDCSVEWDNHRIQHGVSLKGNTYWYVLDSKSIGYIICFDFTRERFGPRLPLPLPFINNGSLSAVREDMLAVLLNPWYTSDMEIWVTNKIEPDAVSWSKFFKVYERPPFMIPANFLIDEEKKVALLFQCNKAYIIGENGSTLEQFHSFARLCNLECSYVPSSVQIN